MIHGGGDEDFEHALALCELLTPGERPKVALRARRNVKLIVANYWPVIVQVADAIEVRRHTCHERIKAILAHVPKPWPRCLRKPAPSTLATRTT